MKLRDKYHFAGSSLCGLVGAVLFSRLPIRKLPENRRMTNLNRRPAKVARVATDIDFDRRDRTIRRTAKTFNRLPGGRALQTLLTLCIVASSWMLSTTAQADTWRWVDGNGVVNYSERKPRGVADDQLTRIGSEQARGRSGSRNVPASQPISQPSSQPTVQAISDSNGDPLALNEQQQARLTELQSAEQARQAQVAKIRQENCELSRRVLANLTGKDRIRVTGADGSQRNLPENERQERIGQAQVGIASNCDA